MEKKPTAHEALDTIKATMRKIPGFTMDSAMEMFALFGIVQAALEKQPLDVAAPTIEPK